MYVEVSRSTHTEAQMIGALNGRAKDFRRLLDHSRQDRNGLTTA